MDREELRKHLRHSKEKLTSLKLKTLAGVTTNEIIALQIDGVLEELNESLKLLDGNTTQVSASAPSQVIGSKDKIKQLNDEIEVLQNFVYSNIELLTARPGQIGKFQSAITNLAVYRGLLEGDVKKKYTGHPSYKAELDDKEIWEKYEELGSFRAVGKALGCDPKTVKERLIRMGHIQK